MVNSNDSSPKLISIIEKPFHWTLRFGASVLMLVIVIFLIFLYNFEVFDTYSVEGRVLKVTKKKVGKLELTAALYTNEHPFKTGDTISVRLATDEKRYPTIISSESCDGTCCSNCILSVVFNTPPNLINIHKKNTKISLSKLEKKSLLPGLRVGEN